MKIARENVEINSSSMADIAFLLLIFFLMTTTISVDKGLAIVLPPDREDQPFISKIHERNIFKILINSKNSIMVENEPLQSTTGLRDQIKKFILNPEQNENLAISPKEAVISIKTDRGTQYATYINILDEVQAAYYEIYGAKVGLTSDEFRNLDQRDPEQRELYKKGKEGIPMNISFAEPTNIK